MSAMWCVVAVAVTYALGSGMVFDPGRWIAHVNFVRERSREGATGLVAFVPNYPFTWDGNRRLVTRIGALLLDNSTLPGVVLGVLGVTAAIVRRERAAWLSITAVSYLAVLFVAGRVAQLRYMMPAALTLAIFAGHAARRAFSSRVLWVRTTGGAAAVAALLLSVLWAIDLTHAMFHDSRYAAAAWLRTVARAGDRVEYFGSQQKQPPMEAWVESGRAFRYLGGNVPPSIDATAVDSIRAGWAERRPRFITLQPDYTSRAGEEYAASCPPQIYADLMAGTIGYRLVKRFQSPPLFGWAHRPKLDYPTVNPPILFFERQAAPSGGR